MTIAEPARAASIDSIGRRCLMLRGVPWIAAEGRA